MVPEGTNITESSIRSRKKTATAPTTKWSKFGAETRIRKTIQQFRCLFFWLLLLLLDKSIFLCCSCSVVDFFSFSSFMHVPPRAFLPLLLLPSSSAALPDVDRLFLVVKCLAAVVRQWPHRRQKRHSRPTRHASLVNIGAKGLRLSVATLLFAKNNN